MTAVRMASMKALSLFSGIGGLDIAAESCGIETAAFCEIEPFAVQVLERRFQGIENHGDITRFTNRTLRELGGSPFHRFKCPADYDGAIDVVHGGFPCQDLSVAGKQAVNLALDTVQSGMEAEGYEVRTLLLPAAAFGAPHKRERMFVIGIRKDINNRYNEIMENAGCELRQGAEFSGAHGMEAGDRNADKPERPGSTLWPTPSVHGNYNRAGVSDKSGNGLSTAVKLWPTPHRNCSNGAGAHGDGGLNIQTAVSLWPTPRANKPEGYSSNGYSPTLAQRVTGEVRPAHGMLSPDWVECLMNYPLGWTDVDCDEPEPWPGWPALMGESQYPYEPPRTVTGCPNRAKRLKCLGNAVVPQQAVPIFEAIVQIHNLITTNVSRETLLNKIREA